MEARARCSPWWSGVRTAASTPRSWTKEITCGSAWRGTARSSCRAESRTTSWRRSGQRCRSDLQPPRDRQQGRARDAGHPRGPRAERLAGGADPAHRAPHGAGASRHLGPERGRVPFARLAHVRRPGRRRPEGALPGLRGARARAHTDQGRRGLGRLGVRGRAPGVRRALRQARGDLHRAERGDDAADRRQDRGQAAGGVGGRGRGAVEQGPGRERGGGAPARGRDRLSADGQGHRRRRRPRHPPCRRRGPARGRLRAGTLRGSRQLRRRNRADGAARRSGPPRGSAGDRRLARDRMGRGRTRLQPPAAQPEGDRGVEQPGAQPRAGARAPRRRRAAGARDRLRRRRDRGVPVRAVQPDPLLPRGQRPAPGRAPGHRDGHGSGSRQAPDPSGRGRPARG